MGDLFIRRTGRIFGTDVEPPGAILIRGGRIESVMPGITGEQLTPARIPGIFPGLTNQSHLDRIKTSFPRGN